MSPVGQNPDMSYTARFMTAMFNHGFKWWGSLMLAYILGVGIFADYSLIRAFSKAWFMIELPEQFPV